MLVALVKKLLDLKIEKAFTPQEKMREQESVLALESHINNVVFQFYGLDEIELTRIISSNMK